MRFDVTQLLREPEGAHSDIDLDLGFQRLSEDLSVNAVKGRLTLTARASRGGVQEISLPEGASVQRVTVDGAEQPFRLRAGMRVRFVAISDAEFEAGRPA